jgi:uncharacterized membrane protein
MVLWFIIGIAVGLAILRLVQLLRSKDIMVKWYEWLIGIVGFGLLLFTIQNLVGSIVEDEPTAAWMMLVAIGLPALIIMAVAWQLVARRQRAS